MRSFKKIAVLLGVIAVIVCADLLLDFVFIPASFVRIHYHNMETKTYDTVVVGTSHGLAAIHPDVLGRKTGGTAANFCLGGEYLRDSYYLTKELLRHQTPRRLVYELDFTYWTTKQDVDFEYGRTYREMPFSGVKLGYFFAKMAEADYRMTAFPWFSYLNQVGNIRKTVSDKFSDAYKAYDPSLHDTADQRVLPDGGNYIINAAPVTEPLTIDASTFCADNFDPHMIPYFEKLIGLCRENGIEFVAITTPVPRETLEASAGYFAAAHDFFTALAAQYGVTYHDFNTDDLPFDTSLAAFSDAEGHMLGKTGDAFSDSLGAYLNDCAAF